MSEENYSSTRTTKPRPTRTTTGTCAKMRNENKRHKVDARRSSVSKKDVKKPSVANASENHTYETCVTGVYTPICSHLLWLHMCYSLHNIIIESQ